MQHTFTDEQMQDAIGDACKEIAKTHPAMGCSITLMSDHNEATRLHLLKSALDKLPEPQPPTVVYDKRGVQIYRRSKHWQINRGSQADLVRFELESAGDDPLNHYEILIGDMCAAFARPTPTADGKTPGEVYQDAFHMQNPEAFTTWRGTSSHRQGQIEQASQAVLAAFGNKPGRPVAFEDIAMKLCAVGWTANNDAQWEGLRDAMPELRAMFCNSDAHEGQPASQPAEIPWTEWHGGPCPLKDEEVEEWEESRADGVTNKWLFPPSQAAGWNLKMKSPIARYRVTKWREGFGPAVDWKVKFEKAEADLLSWKGYAERLSQDHAELSKELANAREEVENRREALLKAASQIDELKARTDRWFNQAKAENGKYLAAVEEIARLQKDTLSTLRPIAEAGDVPAGCARVTGYVYPHNKKGWSLGTTESREDTHFADILWPEAKEPATCEHGESISEYCEFCDAELILAPAVAADPYAELKAAHAEGKVIQWHNGHMWHDLSYSENPLWIHPAKDYRIKPAEPVKPWTPAVGDVVTKANPVQDMALGGQMYWRDLARQLAEVWWKCHNIGASLQHGDIDTDVLFSVVCEKHGGQCFHADTPHNAWLKAEKWLISPDRANFPAAALQLA